MKNKTFTQKEIERFNEEYLNGNLAKHSDMRDWLKDHDQRLIEEIEREVIGEDDRHPAPGNSDGMKYRNVLRAEQRKKLAEYKNS